MRTVPIPKEMVPTDVEARIAVIGPPPGESLFDNKYPPPIEALVLEDGYHIRIVIEEGDIEKLTERPYLWLVFGAQSVPPFVITTEVDALGQGRRPE